MAGIQGSVDLNAFGNKAGFVGRVEGSIRDVWMSLGGVGGVLGAPAGDMRYLEANGGGWSQVFEYGEVYVKKGGAASVSMQ